MTCLSLFLSLFIRGPNPLPASRKHLLRWPEFTVSRKWGRWCSIGACGLRPGQPRLAIPRPQQLERMLRFPEIFLARSHSMASDTGDGRLKNISRKVQ